jgi:hypothetical protein
VNCTKIYFGPSKREIIDYVPFPEYPSQWLACQFKKFIYFRGNNLIKVKVKFTLEQATKAQRGSRGISLLFL